MSENRIKWPAQLGAVIQGLALGGMLILALSELALLQSGASIFKYQGF
ncbi:hypothetical protein [Pseudohalioglobus lutimaris]|nr:hypothetical protein [Pseudohalioglobus lutimaris]